ncbi:hypothetical protein ACFYOA_08040 [Streptomyces iakyrus]|uniref:hypothetical protein n=1 Tax=Streptomyces iakyrus TaxID=68219 RepID=UPI003690F26F
MTVIKMRADELIPGDKFDMRCATGDFVKVTRVRLIENDNPGAQDRIEVKFASDAISSTRTFLAGSIVRVLDA